MELMTLIRQQKFIPLMRRMPQEHILSCVEAMLTAGSTILEMTFDPSDPETLLKMAENLQEIKKRFPEVRLGCGTVLKPEMVRCANENGAEFIVSPNTSLPVMAETHKLGMLSVPGAYTPTEIANAYDAGADMVKIFPVLPGEGRYVKNVMSPLSHIPFMVTGGVTAETIREMIGTGAAALGAGASVFLQEALALKNYKAIQNTIRLFLDKIHEYK